MCLRVRRCCSGGPHRRDAGHVAHLAAAQRPGVKTVKYDLCRAMYLSVSASQPTSQWCLSETFRETPGYRYRFPQTSPGVRSGQDFEANPAVATKAAQEALKEENGRGGR
eukprot:554704-Pyramimonas_sp.AAC.1